MPRTTCFAHHGTHPRGIARPWRGPGGLCSDELGPTEPLLDLLLLKVGLNGDNGPDEIQMAKAIQHAIDHGAKVISLSAVVTEDGGRRMSRVAPGFKSRASRPRSRGV